LNVSTPVAKATAYIAAKVADRQVLLIGGICSLKDFIGACKRLQYNIIPLN
jgi:hypothetical protein